jgi:hypothetical protein
LAKVIGAGPLALCPEVAVLIGVLQAELIRCAAQNVKAQVVVKGEAEIAGGRKVLAAYSATRLLALGADEVLDIEDAGRLAGGVLAVRACRPVWDKRAAETDVVRHIHCPTAAGHSTLKEECIFPCASESVQHQVAQLVLTLSKCSGLNTVLQSDAASTTDLHMMKLFTLTQRP